jgi:diguanylate cyclase (GGDEF)-like protein
MKTRIIGGFALFAVILIAVAGASALQARAHQSDLDDLESHSSTATLLQEAEAQSGIAALLVQRYVVSGDEALVAQIESHTAAAVAAVTGAISRQGTSELTDVTASGASLAEGSGRVVALRQAGDAEGAALAMEEMMPQFMEFRLGLEEVAAQELQDVSDLRARADRAGALAFWLLVGSGTGGAIFGLLVAFLIARSIIRPVSALEETVGAVSEGDLGARAPTKGPSELAHFGFVLNHMIGAVQTRNRELKSAYDELMQRNEELSDARAQAASDPLTGLGNHRSFHSRIRSETAAAGDGNKKVSLILFDIDNFKAINDSEGHLAGDEMLRRLTRVLGEVVPVSDVYRYGGDEFAVVCAGLDQKEASALAGELRAAVDDGAGSENRKLTISLGVATFPDLAASAEELVYRADMAMYWAKSTGKNRVGDWDGLLSRRESETMPEFPNGHRGKVHDAVASLVSALAAKDLTTRDHVERCSWYTAELAKELGLNGEVESVLRLASLLHDVGKLVVPNEVLTKAGPLTEEEWALMRQHPVNALHILSQMDSVAEAIPAVLHHHEHFDGSGYPDGLAGDDIPLASRILLVSDAFDAMTTGRPYRQAMPVEAAIQELRRHSGSQFDPKVVDAFLAVISRGGIHPLNSAARQAGGEESAELPRSRPAP